MRKVITYGTYDLLHYGHIRLLERARELGDYLIVGVTSDDFDRSRGKLNVQQSLAERMEGVLNTGLADEVIVEEYEGQKIDDIVRMGIDVFTVGSDWEGSFDYLRDYCEVVYLKRTEGISSSGLRSENLNKRLGLIGDVPFLSKYLRESCHVNGLDVAAVCAEEPDRLDKDLRSLPLVTTDYEELLESVDAVYLASRPSCHASQIRRAIERGIHVLCESPVVTRTSDYEFLSNLASEQGVILMDAIRPAYATAFHRMLLLVRSGVIGEVVAIDATCTSLRSGGSSEADCWSSLEEWGPVVMLPMLEILGSNYRSKQILSIEDENGSDLFSRLDFVFDNASVSLKVGKGAKSEGELIVSGTKGYIMVPAPWWKPDYFEVRYEDARSNRRYFYQLDGEGVRHELVSFVRAIAGDKLNYGVPRVASEAIVKVIEDYASRIDSVILKRGAK